MNSLKSTLFFLICLAFPFSIFSAEESPFTQCVHAYLEQNAQQIDFMNEEVLYQQLLEMETYVIQALALPEDLEPGVLIPNLENEIENFFLLSSYFEGGKKLYPFFYEEESPTRETPFRDISMNGWGDTPGADPVPRSDAEKPFFSLNLLIEDKKNIRRLLTTMANKNVVQLFLDMKSMNRVGDQIRRVHPLRFIGFILSDPHLKRCLRMIEGDSIKWSSFMEGYEERMKKEAQNDELQLYLPGFAQLLKVDQEEVDFFINNEDYIGLVKHFLRK